MFNNFFATKRNFGKEDIELYGSEAARSFLNKEASLDEKIASIAERENLNQEQIQRIVEEANTVVDLEKQGEKFPLAKTSGVLIIMRKKVPTDIETSDYDAPPCATHPDEKKISFREMLGLDPRPMEMRGPDKKELNIKIVKLAAARNELKGRKTLLEMKYDTNLQGIIKTAEQLYHNDKKALSNIFNLSKIAHSYTDKLIGFVDAVLKEREVLEKNASVVSEDLISNKMKKAALIQNGEHQLMKEIDNVGRIRDDIAHVKKGIIKLDNEINETKEKIKEL